MDDIFDFRKKLVESYKRFSTSFASPRAADISEKVREAYAAGRFWPDPLIQINPNYRKGGNIADLAAQGIIESETAQIFQTGKRETPPAPTPITLYRHQMSALEMVHGDKSYVVINRCVTARAWLTGYYIVEYEQHGSDRAKYGEGLLKKLVKRLNDDKFGLASLKNYRLFYLTYPELAGQIVDYLQPRFGHFVSMIEPKGYTLSILFDADQILLIYADGELLPGGPGIPAAGNDSVRKRLRPRRP